MMKKMTKKDLVKILLIQRQKLINYIFLYKISNIKDIMQKILKKN